MSGFVEWGRGREEGGRRRGGCSVEWGELDLHSSCVAGQCIIVGSGVHTVYTIVFVYLVYSILFFSAQIISALQLHCIKVAVQKCKIKHWLRRFISIRIGLKVLQKATLLAVSPSFPLSPLCQI